MSDTGAGTAGDMGAVDGARIGANVSRSLAEQGVSADVAGGQIAQVPEGESGEPSLADPVARRAVIDELFTETFNSIVHIEERALMNRLTRGLTITEMHTIVAVGMYESNPMNVVAARLSVTTATLTAAVHKLVQKGFIARTRDKNDRRKVMLSLTKKGRLVYRAHSLFHKQMIDEALEDLTDEEEQVLARSLVKVKAFFDARA